MQHLLENVPDVQEGGEMGLVPVEGHIPKPVGGTGMDQMGISDDDFFHLICHVDPALKTKIENGEYVDLDKLLPRDRGFSEGKFF